MRLQLSMLLLPRTARANFWAAKLTSLVDLLQLKTPNVLGAVRRARCPEPGGRPIQRFVPGRGTQDTGQAIAVAHERRGQADVLLRHRRPRVEGPTRRV